MRWFLVFFLFVFSTKMVSAQLFFTDPDSLIIPSLRLPYQPVKERIRSLPMLPNQLVYKKLKNTAIPYPGVRYAIQNLNQTNFENPEINQAVEVLLKYAENEQLKYVIDYLQKYTKQNMATQEQALQILQKYITYDSIEFYRNREHLLTEDYEEYLNTDLQTLVNYIRQDSNYIWLRDASRDSVFMEVLNIADKSVRFWINTGKSSFQRFWASNRLGDSIGTWIEILPIGNRLRIYVDQEVYQIYGVTQEKVNNPSVLGNQIKKEYFDMSSMDIADIRRRYWTYYTEVDFSMSQGKVANWASGGENSLALVSNIRYYWNYNRNKTSLENWIHYRVGFMKNGSEEIRKNEDRFEFNTKLGQKAFKHWYYTAQLNILTQLFNSYQYPNDDERKLIANFLSPGYFTISLGMDYKPNSNFSLVLSPIAGKWNYVRDTTKIDVSRYGVQEGKKTKREAGAQLNLISKIDNLFKVMSLNNEFKIFMSYEKKDKYLNMGKDNEEKKHIPLTANWKMTINFKINYFMTASIYTETIYDENYSRKLQFKENLNLGVKFRF